MTKRRSQPRSICFSLTYGKIKATCLVCITATLQRQVGEFLCLLQESLSNHSSIVSQSSLSFLSRHEHKLISSSFLTGVISREWHQIRSIRYAPQGRRRGVREKDDHVANKHQELQKGTESKNCERGWRQSS